MSNIYENIITAQVKQGNFGGKKGQFGYLVKKDKDRKKEAKKYEKSKPEKDEYEIHVMDGKVNIAMDSNGLADPFVEVYGIKSDGSPKSLFTSKVCKKTLTPNWDQKDTVKFGSNISKFVIELWDHDVLSRNDFIGTVTLTRSQIEYPCTHSIYNDEQSTPVGNVQLSLKKKSSSINSSLYMSSI